MAVEPPRASPYPEADRHGDHHDDLRSRPRVHRSSLLRLVILPGADSVDPVRQAVVHRRTRTLHKLIPRPHDGLGAWTPPRYSGLWNQAGKQLEKESGYEKRETDL